MWPLTKATNSCSCDAYGDRLRLGFFVLKAIRKHPESQRLGFRHGLVSRCTVREDSRKFRHFGYPAPVFFPFVLDREMRRGRHVAILRRVPNCHPTNRIVSVVGVYDGYDQLD